MIQVVKHPITVTTAKDPTDNGIFYYGAFSRRSTATTLDLSQMMAEASSAFSVGEVSGVTLDLPKFIRRALLNGDAVTINGLGTFKPSIATSRIRRNKDDLKTSHLSIRSINFTPDQRLLSQLNQEARFEWIEASRANAEDTDDTPTGTPAETVPTGTTTTDTTPTTDQPSATVPEGSPSGTTTTPTTTTGTTVTNPDGSTTTTYPDGSSVTHYPDGSRTETDAQGNSKTYFA